ncbi:MAG: FMN-binding protein [Gemmatimonadota bacterium]|jgi:electron transport complex protein RnfG
MPGARRTRQAPSRLTGPVSGGTAAIMVPLLAVLAAVAFGHADLGAQTLMTQEEALEAAFPGARLERRTAYLTEDQVRQAGELAGSDVEIDQGIVTYYAAYREGRPAGVAYFDTHRVRTMAEVAMIVVGPDDRIQRVEVLKFMEPPEYRAPDGWIEQLEGRPLDDDLSLRGGVRTLTGATLTARALTRAARRVLAFHAVIAPYQGSP